MEAVTPVCRVCGRAVAKMPRHGKQHRPHKCPHGVWCVTGNPRLMNANHAPLGGPNYCRQCAERKH